MQDLCNEIKKYVSWGPSLHAVVARDQIGWCPLPIHLQKSHGKNLGHDKKIASTKKFLRYELN